MTEVNRDENDDMVPTAFRLSDARRRLMLTIGRELGHKDLSETLRDAVDEYIAAYLLGSKSKDRH